MLVRSPDEKRIAMPSTDVFSTCTMRLRNSPYAPVRNVSCETRAGTLILTGTVPSYYLKQVAQCVAREIPGVAQVENRIHVKRAAPPDLRHPGGR